jgi:hypothetical protein
VAFTLSAARPRIRLAASPFHPHGKAHLGLHILIRIIIIIIHFIPDDFYVEICNEKQVAFTAGVGGRVDVGSGAGTGGGR